MSAPIPRPRPALLAGQLLFGTLLVACQPEKVSPALPPETTVGANQAGCLVDGNVLIPRNAWGRSGTSLAYRLGTTAASSNFSLGITDEKSQDSALLLIEADSMVLEEGKTYPFSLSAHKGVAQGQYYSPDGQYRTQSPASGTLTITWLDRQANLVAGRFEFVATDRTTGRQVRVTQGRFDYKSE
ncbi:hypothetical protein [Hymenobacter wooponensis]|uniref:Lipoprotein n=1 Tax=Hymenobacter wooponensis TaxID=1525360 RepID=A0A4Z0MDM2_9BACT|nr:hypothetical protein [Hymenobacter wooponensis]TGD77601.1 hypothetical protein EU557_22770 [Hymenobacter wooponensis]